VPNKKRRSSEVGVLEREIVRGEKKIEDLREKLTKMSTHHKSCGGGEAIAITNKRAYRSIMIIEEEKKIRASGGA